MEALPEARDLEVACMNVRRTPRVVEACPGSDAG